LINVSAREAFLTEMLSLLRPGGTVALEDVDNVCWLCQPPHPSWDILLNAFHTVFHAGVVTALSVDDFRFCCMPPASRISRQK
jgi:hypothetical protein